MQVSDGPAVDAGLAGASIGNRRLSCPCGHDTLCAGVAEPDTSTDFLACDALGTSANRSVLTTGTHVVIARDALTRHNRDVASTPAQTTAAFLEALPALLDERSMSAHALAKKAGVSHSHLSRAKREKDYKSLSPALISRFGEALDLPAGYFPEEREAAVFEHLRQDTQLRDELYQRLVRERS